MLWRNKWTEENWLCQSECLNSKLASSTTVLRPRAFSRQLRLCNAMKINNPSHPTREQRSDQYLALVSKAVDDSDRTEPLLDYCTWCCCLSNPKV